MANTNTASPKADGLETIALVEPDILVRMVIAEYLRECGYRVIEAVSAADVLTVLAVGRTLNVVLSEVQLPGDVDGFGLARHLRENHPSIDVILTSTAQKTAVEAGTLCDEGPLSKPYHPQEVIRRINTLRGRRGRSGAEHGAASERATLRRSNNIVTPPSD